MSGARGIFTLALVCLLPATAAAQADAESLPPPQPGYARRLSGFGLGVQGAEALNGVVAGDSDRVRDAAEAGLYPETLIGLVMFDGALQGANRAAALVPGRGGVMGYLRHNMALAGALTAVDSVRLDLNGFSYADAARLDFRKLEGAQASLAAVDLEEVGITLGAFAAAQPLWRAQQSVARRFGGMVARRFARTAAVKAGLAVAPTGWTQVAAAGITVFDVVMAGVDLAGLLLTAEAVDATAGDAYRAWRSSGRLREAGNELEALVEQSANSRVDNVFLASRRPSGVSRPVSEAAFVAAIEQMQAAYGDRRNDFYVDVAGEDMRLLRRLRQRTDDPDALAERLQRVSGEATDYGRELALLAQTAGLIEEFGDDPELRELIERHHQRVRAALEEATQARALLYGQELAALRGARDEAITARQRYLLDERIAVLEETLALEAELARQIQAEPRPRAQAGSLMQQAGGAAADTPAGAGATDVLRRLSASR